MDPTKIKTQIVKFNRARNNLLGVVAFTLVNLFLITFGTDLSFLFSAFVPQMILIILEDFSVTGGLIIAILCTSVYLLCYFLSKRWRVFIIIALMLFAIDTLIMLGIFIIGGTVSYSIPNIAFHAWIMYYLVTGTIAWVKLLDITPDQIKLIQQEVAQEAKKEELNSALNAVAPAFDHEVTQHNGMYVTDDYIRSEIRASFQQNEKLYLFEDIPHEKLENAKRSYASDISGEETIICLFDDTVKGSANDGFLLTTKYLYCKNFGQTGNTVYIPNITEIRVPKYGVISSHIIVTQDTNSDIEVHVTQTKAAAEKIFNTLNDTIKILKTQAQLALS